MKSQIPFIAINLFLLRTAVDASVHVDAILRGRQEKGGSAAVDVRPDSDERILVHNFRGHGKESDDDKSPEEYAKLAAPENFPRHNEAGSHCSVAVRGLTKVRGYVRTEKSAASTARRRCLADASPMRTRTSMATTRGRNIFRNPEISSTP